MQHPYPFQLYAFIIGFIIVFRTNFAYQRYWEATRHAPAAFRRLAS